MCASHTGIASDAHYSHLAVKKSIWIFLLAIILPSLILGWLALLSTDDQQVLVEKWTSELYQKEAEGVATSVRAAVEEQRRGFNSAVREMIGNQDAEKLAVTFATDLAKVWTRKAVGFVINKDGMIVSPTDQQARNNKEWQEFLMGNSAFLSANVPATVYWMSGEELNRPDNILYNKKGKVALSQAPVQSKLSEQAVDEKAATARFDAAKVQSDGSLAPGLGVSSNSLATGTLQSPKEETLKEKESGRRELKLDQPRDGTLADHGLTDADASAAPDKYYYDSSVEPTGRRRMRVATISEPEKDSNVYDSSVQNSGSFGLSDKVAGDADSLRLGGVEFKPSPKKDNLTFEFKNEFRVTPNTGAQFSETAPVNTPALEAPVVTAAPAAAPVANNELLLSADGQPKRQSPSYSGRGLSSTELNAALAVSNKSEVVLPSAADTSGWKAEGSHGEKAKTLSKPLPAPAAPQAAVPEVGGESVSKDEVKQTELYAYKTTVSRSVTPQRQQVQPSAAWSQLTSATADFRALTEGSTEGIISRYVQDKLEIIFWMRPSQAPEMIFGCRLHVESLEDLWKDAVLSHVQSNYADSTGVSLPTSASKKSTEYVLALLDDRARPVITQPAAERARDWKRPFVATEIGEILPHWEVALYLIRPDQLQLSAKNVRRTLIFLIITSLAAIGWGCWVVMADTRRQLVLAQKKTDFVSNVSHELKTPLTSIRMFAELMQNGNAQTTSKFPQYLRIIMVEAERLTRLINNVLDFAKIERRQKTLDRKPLDLHEVVARVWEGQELHLRENGFVTRWEMAEPPYPVTGDEDALAQVLVNLISNAEKYSGNSSKEVELHTYMDGAFVCVSVLDRGLGVPNGEERKIFEAFYRAHDSLSSGIQGSGLGLTLAQRIVREQGGEIIYHPRNGGGSVFTLRMPLAKST